MKKWIAMLLILATLLTAVSCGESAKNDASASGVPSETPVADEDEPPLFPFGVYYLMNDQGQKLSKVPADTKLAFNDENEKRTRFTLYYRTGIDGKKHYMIYEGDDTVLAIAGQLPMVGGEIAFKYDLSSPTRDSCFDILPSESGDSFQIVCAAHPELCVTYDQQGKVVYGNTDDQAAQSFWKIETAPSENYIPFTSKDGHIVLRIPEEFTTKRSIGFNPKLAQIWVDYFEEAYYYEIELTGYVPYETIVIKAYEDEDIVAGVVNNYNVITANVDFMKSELTNTATRYNQYHVMEIGFGMLHEMGHMFDSGRGWNFESEAWTDLKLCYCIKRLGEKYPDVVFAATPAGYSPSQYFTYDTMVECLGQHDNPQEGGMTTVYAFFGCAKIFLIIANEVGWDPYVKTFHWFQDNNVTEKNLERVDRFYKFVEKLSEFSGQDIHAMIDEINPASWGVMEDYFSGKTNKTI